MKLQLLWIMSLLLLLSISGCLSPSLERQDVPIHWGMRVDSVPADEAISKSFDYLSDTDPILVELALYGGNDGLPRTSFKNHATLVPLISEHKGPWTAALTTTSQKELFPGDSLPDMAEWFNVLEGTVHQIFSNFHQHPPERVVLGGSWPAVEGESTHWKAFWDKLHRSHQGVEFGYGMDAEAEPPVWISDCDFLAIKYPPLADPNPKPRAMALNPSIAELAQQVDLPVLIYHSNLMGPYKAAVLKNQLRFWPEEMELQGIFINTLYPKIPPLDTTSYFGLHTSPDLMEFLEEYQK